MTADTAEIAIRAATPADLPAVKAIYDHYIATSIATFDLEPSDAAIWPGKLERMYVAVVRDDVLGFAYSSPYRTKPAYEFTAESTIYIAPGQTGRGIGRRLYGALIERLRTDGFHTVIGMLASPNPESTALHEAMGFEHVGTTREVGRKFDRWIDVVTYQLML